jgi:nicotinamidase-related amidase
MHTFSQLHAPTILSRYPHLLTASKMPHNDTAVLLIDPYNDYIHPSGKVYNLCKESLEATDTITHMKTLVKAARANNIPIFYCLHQPWKTGNFDHWTRMGPFHKMLKEQHVAEVGTWGSEIYEGLEPDLANGDILVGKHWNAK